MKVSRKTCTQCPEPVFVGEGRRRELGMWAWVPAPSWLLTTCLCACYLTPLDSGFVLYTWRECIEYSLWKVVFKSPVLWHKDFLEKFSKNMSCLPTITDTARGQAQKSHSEFSESHTRSYSSNRCFWKNQTTLSTPAGHTTIGWQPWGTETLRRMSKGAPSERMYLCWTCEKASPLLSSPLPLFHNVLRRKKEVTASESFCDSNYIRSFAMMTL